MPPAVAPKSAPAGNQGKPADYFPASFGPLKEEPAQPSSYYGFFSIHQDWFMRGGNDASLTGVELGFGYKQFGLQAIYREQGNGENNDSFPFQKTFAIAPVYNVMNAYRRGAGGIPHFRLGQVGPILGVAHREGINDYLVGARVRGLIGYAGIIGVAANLSLLTTPLREDKEWKVLLGISVSLGVVKPVQ